MRLGWASDIHLDHLRLWPDKRQDLAREWADRSDALVLTGDLSSAKEFGLVTNFAGFYRKPIYFVLGNHDFWGSTFKAHEEYIRTTCSLIDNLTWLTESEPIQLTPDVQLCGVDGWYDAQFGNWTTSDFFMVDWKAIGEFKRALGTNRGAETILDICRNRAGVHTAVAKSKLDKCNSPRVFFATHVPPYEESAMHEGRPSSQHALPWYTSRVLGEALSRHTAHRSGQQFTTLCGHVHSRSTYQEGDNHVVLCAEAEYGAPRLERVFEL